MTPIVADTLEGRNSTSISRQPLSGSRKVYFEGTLYPNLRVPSRAITLSPTRLSNGQSEFNPPVTVYDTSGPYTDLQARIDVRAGLIPQRLPWLADRGDVESYEGRSVRPEDNGYRSANQTLAVERFPDGARRAPLRAKSGKNVTQLHYARRGIITPEMEFIAIRENQRIEGYEEIFAKQHRGHDFGEHQSRRARADDHRPQFSGEDQREHRQLRDRVVDRGGGRQDGVGDPLGRGHGDGPFDRQEHS
jgi:hypothetical protein